MRLLFISFMVGVLFSACNKRESAPSVTVSIPPLGYLVEQIGGDALEVETLAPAASDPETFEPSMNQMRRLVNSKLLFITGLLPFEVKVSNTLGASTSAVNLSDSIDVIAGTHGDNDEADPHIWTSLRNVKVMARQIAAALSEAYPEHAAMFADNLNKFENQLSEKNKQMEEQLSSYVGSSFLVWHPSLSYFARDYGLHQIVLGEEHKEMSINQLRERIQKAKVDSARVFFYQPEFDSRQAQVVTDATGLKPVNLSPLSADVLQTIEAAADAIVGN